MSTTISASSSRPMTAPGGIAPEHVAAFLRTMLDGALAGVALFDTDRRFLLVNDALARINGVPAEDHVGRTITEVVPGLAAEAEPALSRALAGEHVMIDLTGDTPGTQGAIRTWEEEWRPIRNEPGEVIGVGVIVRELTEEHRTRRALAEAYAHLEAVFETAPVGLAVYDCDLQAVRLNSLIAEWNEIDSAHAIGQHVSQLFPHFWPRIAAHFARALSGERFTVEIDRRALGQEHGPTHSSISYAPVEHRGEIAGVIVCVVDTSRQVSHERALAAAYAQLQAIFDNVPVGIAVYDRSLRAVRMNSRMAQWNKLDPAHLVGMRASALFPQTWHVIEPHYHMALNGEPNDADVNRRSHGQHHGPAFVAASYRPIYVGQEVVGVTVTATDITERKEAERRAEADIRFRDDLMSIASHELRTPLTSIIGLTERLERVASSSPQVTLGEAKDDLTVVRGESQRLARTLDLLLDLVGLAAGASGMEPEPVALAPLIRRQARMVRERYPRLVVVEDIEQEAIVDSDGDRIVQIISNLLENAAKYAGPDAHVTVRVRRDRSCACIDVQDDGPGIPPEQQELIFDRRYRGQGGGGGLGLGLYVSRIVASRLGGVLRVRSAPGQGATFTLGLPAAD